MLDQRIWRHFDWTLFTIVIVLCLIGIAMIYSATVTAPDPALEDVWVRQVAFFGIGVVVLFVVAAIDYRLSHLRRASGSGRPHRRRPRWHDRMDRRWWNACTADRSWKIPVSDLLCLVPQLVL